MMRGVRRLLGNWTLGAWVEGFGAMHGMALGMELRSSSDGYNG